MAGIVKLLAPRISMAGDMPDQVGFLQRKITFKMTKARDLLGWSPRVDLETGVAACAAWLREQELLA
jgi:nucleoside-diphosphate-sugar epimerase